METFSALLALCVGNSPVTGEFPSQRPVTRSLDVFFDLRLNKRLSKQPRRWWFETPLGPLWRHHNEVKVPTLGVHWQRPQKKCNYPHLHQCWRLVFNLGCLLFIHISRNNVTHWPLEELNACYNVIRDTHVVCVSVNIKSLWPIQIEFFCRYMYIIVTGESDGTCKHRSLCLI